MFFKALDRSQEMKTFEQLRKEKALEEFDERKGSLPALHAVVARSSSKVFGAPEHILRCLLGLWLFIGFASGLLQSSSKP